MPRLPNGSLTERTASKGAGFKKMLTNKKKSLDLYMALTIFLLTIIELISYYTTNDTIINDVSTYKYMLFYYPLYTIIELLIISLFFLVKCYRYISCIYSKIVSWMFFALQLNSLLALTTHNSISIYLELTYPIIYISIITLIIIKSIRWFLRQPLDL